MAISKASTSVPRNHTKPAGRPGVRLVPDRMSYYGDSPSLTDRTAAKLQVNDSAGRPQIVAETAQADSARFDSRHMLRCEQRKLRFGEARKER